MFLQQFIVKMKLSKYFTYKNLFFSLVFILFLFFLFFLYSYTYQTGYEHGYEDVILTIATDINYTGSSILFVNGEVVSLVDEENLLLMQQATLREIIDQVDRTGNVLISSENVDLLLVPYIPED